MIKMSQANSKAKTTSSLTNSYTPKDLENVCLFLSKIFEEIKGKIKDGEEPKIQNVVSTVYLLLNPQSGTSQKPEIDLIKICKLCNNTEYDPSSLLLTIERFPALIIRSKEPKATALIFKAGKMVITGTKSPDMSSEAAKKFLKKVNS